MPKKSNLKCPKCVTNKHSIKAGKDKNGKQKYYCKNQNCKHIYSTDDYFLSSIYGRRGRNFPIEKRIEICDEYRKMVKEGISQRKVAKRFGISPTTLKNWEENYDGLNEALQLLNEDFRKEYFKEKKSETYNPDKILRDFLRQKK